MMAASQPRISWHINDFESESFCSEMDEYYLDQLFFAVESLDVTMVKNFTNEHLRHLCRIRRLFHSEWSAPAKEKQTAYQRACFLGYTDIVHCMLKAGVRFNQVFSSANTNDVERSAFMFACHSGSVSTIRALLEAVSNDYAEHYKCRNRLALCSSSFAKQYFIPERGWIEESSSVENGLVFVFPIHFAIAQDNLEMARLIVTSTDNELDIESGWKPMQHGSYTPLHIACLFNRSVSMIELVLSFGESYSNPLIQTSNQGIFADQLTTDTKLIEYLRPKRLHIIAALEQERLKNLEQMQSGIPYQIFIKTLSGQLLTLTVTGYTTTAELRALLQNEYGIPLDQQKVFFNGQSLSIFSGEILPLIHFNIKKDSILHIIIGGPARGREGAIAPPENFFRGQ
jgi:ankyrin repeat protein